MNVRVSALLAITIVTGLTAGGAEAAAKKPKPTPPVCNLVKDGPGDGKGLNGADDQNDILTADVASDAKNITAVLRLKAAPTADDQASPIGKLYTFGFTAGKAGNVYLQARLTKLGGAAYSANYGSSSSFKTGSATGSITGTDIRITVPLADLGIPGALKPGSPFSALTASAKAMLTSSAGTPAQDSITGTGNGDDAAADAKTIYTAGAKSCVTP